MGYFNPLVSPIGGKFLTALNSLIPPQFADVAVNKAMSVTQQLRREIANHYKLLVAIEALCDQEKFEEAFGSQHPYGYPDFHQVVDGYALRSHSPDPIPFTKAVALAQMYGHRLANRWLDIGDKDFRYSSTLSNVRAIFDTFREINSARDNLLVVQPYGTHNRIALSYTINPAALYVVCITSCLPSDWYENDMEDNPYVALCNRIASVG